MGDLRILVVDDRQDWQEELQQILKRIGSNVKVDVALGYEDAFDALGKVEYALITVDIALNGQSKTQSQEETDHLGMALLKDIRTSRTNKHCGIIVVTGIATPLLVLNEAYRDYRIHNFIEKDKFDSTRLVNAARNAIRDARLEEAEARSRERWRAIITYDEQHLLAGDVIGPHQLPGPSPKAADQQRLNVASLSRHADNLNILLLQEDPNAWRDEFRLIRNELQEAFEKDLNVRRCLDIAKLHAQQSGKSFWLQFNGPAVGLGVPFELLHDGDDYLSLHHIVTRRLPANAPTYSPKAIPFHSFLRELMLRREKLRILLVGANYNDTVPEAELEVKELRESIRASLEQIGINCDVDLLDGEDANNATIRAALRGGHYHIFHYAGHGRFKETLPEASGLVLHDGTVLAASTLNLLMHNPDLYLVYLSCCLSARTAPDTKRGDFHGILEAIANANVPVVVGYRWTVMDDSALQLAKNFYETLWYTFSPGEALLEARREATLGNLGRDDETWASPVMIMQNA